MPQYAEREFNNKSKPMDKINFLGGPEYVSLEISTNMA